MKIAGQGELDRLILGQAQEISPNSPPGTCKDAAQTTTHELSSLCQSKSNYLLPIALSYQCV